MTAFELYLLTLIPKFGALFVVASIILAIILIFEVVCLIDDSDFKGGKITEEEEEKRYNDHKRQLKKFGIIFCICVFIAIITPTQKELGLIVAVSYVTTSELPQKSMEYLNKYLDTQIESLDTKHK